MTTNRSRAAAATIAALAAIAAIALTTSPSTAAARVTCQGHVATIIGTDGPDHLVGTPQADVIDGLGGADQIEGRGGNDLICGDGGRDTLRGGNGNDRLDSGDKAFEDSENGGAGDDVLLIRGTGAVYSEPGNDRIRFTRTGIPTFDFSSSPHGVHLDLRSGMLSGRGHTRVTLSPRSYHVNVIGSSHDDTISGTSLPDTLSGGPGNDVLRGGGNNDFLDGGSGHNRLFGQKGTDYFTEESGSGGRGTTTAFGGGGKDRFYLSANDDVHGGPGHDRVSLHIRPGARGVIDGGGARNSLLLWFRPAAQHPGARVHVDLARGVIRVDGQVSSHLSKQDFHTVYAARSARSTRWSILGTNQDDALFASTRPGQTAVLRGRGGDDVLHTRDGNDVLYGGPGTDSGYAGDGTDTCFSIEKPYGAATSTGCETSSP
jgi:Ca2+-binding RTX toxin-like protein